MQKVYLSPFGFQCNTMIKITETLSLFNLVPLSTIVITYWFSIVMVDITCHLISQSSCTLTKQSTYHFLTFNESADFSDSNDTKYTFLQKSRLVTFVN